MDDLRIEYPFTTEHWIRTREQKPRKKDENRWGEVLALSTYGGTFSWPEIVSGESVRDDPERYPAWMPLPKPVKVKLLRAEKDDA